MNVSGSGRPAIVVEWSEPVSRSSLERSLPALVDQLLPEFLPMQRWYGEKDRTLVESATRVRAWIEASSSWFALATALLSYADGTESVYFVPIAISLHPSANDLAIIDAPTEERWFVSDACTHEPFQKWLVNAVATGAELRAPGAQLIWRTPNAPIELPLTTPRLLTGEQSNSNIAYGETLLIKVMRRVQSGVNPDVELGRYLSQQANLATVPRLLADWTLLTERGESSIGMAQAFVPGAVDGWSWMLSQLAQSGDDANQQRKLQREIALLGAHTAEIHLALAAATGKEIAPERVTASDAGVWRSNTREFLDGLLPRVKAVATTSNDDETRQLIQQFISAAPVLVAELTGYEESIGLLKTRVHGDYHLGQTLHRDHEWKIIDFEGEPARSLEARRARSSPLKDVAGMIRSLAYATAFASRVKGAWSDPEGSLERSFLTGYRTSIGDSMIVPSEDAAFTQALYPWIIDKAIYEIAYELNNRPEWLWAPIASLIEQIQISEPTDEQ